MKTPGASRRESVGEERRDRAQMVLVTALLLATVLVGLALILNSAIYAENQATRRSAVGASEAVQFQLDLNEGAGAALEATNTQDFGSYADYVDDYRQSVSDWEGMVAKRQAGYGVATGTSFSSKVDGTRVVQDSSSTFESADSKVVSTDFSNPDLVCAITCIAYDNWLVAHDTSIRAFRMTFDRSKFTTYSSASAEADVEAYVLDLDQKLSLSLSEPPFATAFDTDGDGIPDYAYSVYRSGTNEMSVVVSDVAAGTTVTCSTTTKDPTLDIAAETFGGTDCPGLELLNPTNLGSSFDIAYVRGDNAHGTYEFVAKDDLSSYRSGLHAEYTVEVTVAGTTILDIDDPEPLEDEAVNGDTGNPTSDPRTEQALYSAKMTMSMDSGKFEYSRTSVRVAPDELDED